MILKRRMCLTESNMNPKMLIHNSDASIDTIISKYGIRIITTEMQL